LAVGNDTSKWLSSGGMKQQQSVILQLAMPQCNRNISVCKYCTIMVMVFAVSITVVSQMDSGTDSKIEATFLSLSMNGLNNTPIKFIQCHSIWGV
jgi:hypothetical protein